MSDLTKAVRRVKQFADLSHPSPWGHSTRLSDTRPVERMLADLSRVIAALDRRTDALERIIALARVETVEEVRIATEALEETR